MKMKKLTEVEETICILDYYILNYYNFKKNLILKNNYIAIVTTLIASR